MKTIEHITNKKELEDYLNEVDKDFNTPLSNKISISIFASKLVEYGKVFVIKENKETLAMISFYCNDTITHKAYLTILSTKERARGKGYARLLITKMISICKENKMQHIYCDSVNPIAISLYKSFGFTEYKKEENKSYLELNL